MHSQSFQIGDEAIELSTGRIARQAHGAVVLRHRETFILATVVAGGEANEGGFLPLTVDYRERRSAVGRIPGNYFRRETRAGEHEILTSRLIDRTLRPLFGEGFTAETIVDVTVHSADAASDLAGLALIAAGAAVHLSDLPFNGPVAGMRIARLGGRLRLGADEAEATRGDLDLVVSGGRDGLVMIEGGAGEIGEDDLLAALEAARAAFGPIFAAVDALREAAGRQKRAVTAPGKRSADLGPALDAALDAALKITEKQARRAALEALRPIARDTLADIEPAAADAAFATAVRHHTRQNIIAGRRLDGRGPTQIRPIDCEAHLLPGAHGSALFTRGETQALVSATFGGPREGQDHDRLFGARTDRFLLHYNFPGFAVGEPRRGGGPGRREIGHGHLARRALLGVLPDEAAWPFTLRLVSDITESNGSSSMATVCGGALALLSAGVPLKAPVAGIAMGLVREGEAHAILSDILGDEDHLGDMDFKIAGTAGGITAIQLDNKLGTLPLDILRDALTQAAEGRRHILDAMGPLIERLASEPPPHAPRHASLRVNTARVGQIIGKGGQTLSQLQGRTGTRIEVSRDGVVLILGPTHAAVREARRAIEAIAIELRKGGLYLARVSGVQDYGVFVKIAEHEGLVHQSELGDRDPRTLNVGDELLVRVLGADERGRVRLSHRAADGGSALEALNA
ncbi:MAG: polyribonucleotide nucleotidyltransferase [Myxococcales bacterium]|nr:polyribonucleotide nucleotidyltransferase [Myxococcales bacterium]